MTRKGTKHQLSSCFRSKSLYSSFRSIHSASSSSRHIICGDALLANGSATAPNGLGDKYGTTADLAKLLKADSPSSSTSDGQRRHCSPPDSELDSGISVNVNYDNHLPRYLAQELERRAAGHGRDLLDEEDLDDDDEDAKSECR